MAGEESGHGSPPETASASGEDYMTVVTQLASPVVVLNRQGQICFMNPSARELLDRGMKKRLESHLNNRPKQRAWSHVRFRLANGAELVLQIKLTHIQWMGERAVLAALSDITSYVAALYRLQNLNQELLKRSAQQAQSEAKMLSQKLAAAATTAKELKAEREQLQEQFNKQSAELESAKQQLANAISQRERFKTQLTEAASQLERANEQLASEIAQRGQFQQECEALRQQFAEASRAAKELQAMRAPLEEQMREGAAALEKANQQLAHEAARREQAEQEGDSLRREIAEINRTTEELETERARVEKELRQQIAELEQAKQQLEQELAESKRTQGQAEKEPVYQPSAINVIAAAMRKAQVAQQQETDQSVSDGDGAESGA